MKTLKIPPNFSFERPLAEKRITRVSMMVATTPRSCLPCNAYVTGIMLRGWLSRRAAGVQEERQERRTNQQAKEGRRAGVMVATSLFWVSELMNKSVYVYVYVYILHFMRLSSVSSLSSLFRSFSRNRWEYEESSTTAVQ